MTTIIELADEVRILELELQKLVLENRITELKAEQSQSDTIEELKDQNIEDLKELYDFYEKKFDDMVTKNGELNDTIVRMRSVSVARKLDVQGLNRTIEELRDQNIEDLKEMYDFHEGELEWFKDRVSGRDLTIESLNKMIESVRNGWFLSCDTVHALEAELSTRRKDSEVLMTVVEIVKEWKTLSAMVPTYDMRHLRDLVKDYFGAPEGPPEPPIDESQEITVTVALLELP